MLSITYPQLESRFSIDTIHFPQNAGTNNVLL